MQRRNILRISVLVVCVIGISLLHYLTPLHLPMLHDIFQRLYYLPIILSAFWFGFRGGLGCAILVTICYAPHVLFQWGGHLAMEMEKYLEVLLYNVVGGITGFLTQQERSRRQQLEATAKGLEESYQQLQRQSELIIRVEEQLRRAERLSALGELSAILAHEIRNPLASIRGTAEILKDDHCCGGEARREFLEILMKESDRLNRVVEDFLRMARPEPTAIAACDLVEELRNIITLLSAEARNHKVRLDFRSDPLPSFYGDSEKLRQAFMNIILNAIQASPLGGTVVIAARPRDPDMVEISFSDSGTGIGPGALQQIFEPFFTTKGGGTGLGLPITKKIIESHGGAIEVRSEPGAGATFVVTLPLSKDGGSS